MKTRRVNIAYEAISTFRVNVTEANIRMQRQDKKKNLKSSETLL